MTEKVSLSKEVAEAIEALREIGLSSFTIVVRLNHNKGLGSSGLNPYLDVINEWLDGNYYRIDVLMNALVNGYEIEKSPEEEVREYYRNVNELIANHQEEYDAGTRSGIIITLNILGIKIEGVNAE